MVLDPALATTLRVLATALFAAGVAHKLRHFSRFAATVEQYLSGFKLRDKGLGIPSACVIIALEMSVLGACLWPGQQVTAAVLTSSVLLLYAAAMAVNLYRGNRLLDCGCAWGTARQPVVGAFVVRNFVLAGLATMLALPVADRSLSALDLLSIVFAACVSALLYGSVNQLSAAGAARGRSLS